MNMRISSVLSENAGHLEDSVTKSDALPTGSADFAEQGLLAALADRDRTVEQLLGIIEGAEVGTFELDLVTYELRVGGRWSGMLGRDPDAKNIFEFSDFRELVHP